MKVQIGWCLAVLLGALVFAGTIAVFLEIAPGLLILFPLLALWPARNMTWEHEFDLAMRTLTKGAR